MVKTPEDDWMIQTQISVTSATTQFIADVCDHLELQTNVPMGSVKVLNCNSNFKRCFGWHSWTQLWEIQTPALSLQAKRGFSCINSGTGCIALVNIYLSSFCVVKLLIPKLLTAMLTAKAVQERISWKFKSCVSLLVRPDNLVLHHFCST